ncbi:MAG: tetratricopeptide repeat protein, partial [Acidobacteria bacterium]|nr:tetratricopeptide repeat protein [Acidobacteriota bacterium]
EKIGSLQGDSRKPSLSDFRSAIASLEKAQAIRRQLLSRDPGDAENRRLLADNLRLLSIRRPEQSDVEGGFRDVREALKIYEGLIAENPSSLELQRAFLETQTEYASGYADSGRYAETIPLLQPAVNRIEELRRANPNETETLRILARGRILLGIALSWESRQAEAEAEIARGVEIAESLVARSPGDTNLRQDLWRTYQLASSIYEELNDAKAFELLVKARQVVEETIALDRANVQARHNLSKTFSRLGVTASYLGKPAEALAYLEQALAILSELQERDAQNRGYDRDLSLVYKRIGDAKYKGHDLTGSLAAYQKSLLLFEKKIRDDAANTLALREVAVGHRNIAWVHADLVKITAGQLRRDHLREAKEHYRQALELELQVQARGALPEVDRKVLEEVQAALQELDKL